MQIDAKFAWPFLARVPDCHHEKIYAIIIKKSLKIRPKIQIFGIFIRSVIILNCCFLHFHNSQKVF